MKTKFFFSISILILSLAFSLNAQTVDSGDFSLNSKTPGYSLNKNTGERTVMVEIKFNQKFTTKPHVLVSITKIDASKDQNLRFSVEVAIVTTEELIIKVKTWAETQIHSIGGKWLAVAAE